MSHPPHPSVVVSLLSTNWNIICLNWPSAGSWTKELSSSVAEASSCHQWQHKPLFVIIRRRCIALFCCDIRWNPCQGSYLDFHHDACLCDSFWWFDYVRQPRTREISWDWCCVRVCVIHHSPQCPVSCEWMPRFNIAVKGGQPGREGEMSMTIMIKYDKVDNNISLSYGSTSAANRCGRPLLFMVRTSQQCQTRMAASDGFSDGRRGFLIILPSVLIPTSNEQVFWRSERFSDVAKVRGSHSATCLSALVCLFFVTWHVKEIWNLGFTFYLMVYDRQLCCMLGCLIWMHSVCE